MKKFGFLLSVHNRIDDLMCHLEILNYCPFPKEIIIVWSGEYKESYMKVIRDYHNVKVQSYGHYIGPLLATVAGIKKANELGLDLIVYRNADDWLFNYNFEKSNIKKIEDGKYVCAGYNWLNYGVDFDLTMNQLYLDVGKFYDTCEEANEYFIRSPKGFICEYKMPKWVKSTCDMRTEFMRLSGREQFPGIGIELQDIQKLMRQGKLSLPKNYWELWDRNNRYFNEDWQLIGCHDNDCRIGYWERIRNQIPYSQSLEKEKWFSKFLDAAYGKLDWNIPDKSEPVIPAKKEPAGKAYKRKIF